MNTLQVFVALVCFFVFIPIMGICVLEQFGPLELAIYIALLTLTLFVMIAYRIGKCR